jgi:hypothetical protein
MTQNIRTAQIPRRLAVLLLIAFGIPALAQSGRGTLIGSVKDTSGAIIPGAPLN